MLSDTCHGFLAPLCHADQIQLTLLLLACFVPFGIVQAVHCGAPYAAACSLANSVQPLLTLIIVEALITFVCSLYHGFKYHDRVP